MKVLDEIKNINWVVKVIKSCESLEQHKNAVRLTKIWVKNTAPSVGNQGWRNYFKSVDNHYAVEKYLNNILHQQKLSLIRNKA